MTKRRKFLTALGTVAAGSAAAVGTGAFTSVRANRSVTVSVADDSDALLALDQQTGSPNSQYAQVTSSGTIEVDLDNSDTANGGSGVNRNAETSILNIFRIQNQGTQPVFVYVDPNTATPNEIKDDSPPIYVDPQATSRPNAQNYTNYDASAINVNNTDAISFTGIWGYADPTDGFGNDAAYSPEDLTLGVGQSMNFGLYINEYNSDGYSVNLDIVAQEEFAGSV